MQTSYSILGIVAALALVAAIATNLTGEAFAATGGEPGPNFNQGQCQKFFKGIAGQEVAHDICHDDGDDNEE